MNFSVKCLFQDPDHSDLTKDVGNPVAYPPFLGSLIMDIARTGELEKTRPQKPVIVKLF